MDELKDKTEGMAKEAAGTVTGNDSQKQEGRAQQTMGNVKGAANDVKDRVSGAVDDASSDRNEDKI
ncbi:MAG: CsbD family protein [Chloroflexota bacterium]